MPSSKKTLHFLGSALLTSVSVGLLGFSMSTDWAETNMLCARGGSGFFNGSAVVTLTLFNGTVFKDFCPLFGGSNEFYVIPTLVELGSAPAALHTVSVCLLALCLLLSACSILISLYNSVSNPYQTFMGPVGVYACSSLSACLSVVVLILFVVNINVTSMAEDVVKKFSGSVPVDLTEKVSDMQLGYYLVIPYTVLSLAAIGVIFMYDHAAYTHRREQQRPTEDAPKEIMMY